MHCSLTSNRSMLVCHSIRPLCLRTICGRISGILSSRMCFCYCYFLVIICIYLIVEVACGSKCLCGSFQSIIICYSIFYLSSILMIIIIRFRTGCYSIDCVLWGRCRNIARRHIYLNIFIFICCNFKVVVIQNLKQLCLTSHVFIAGCCLFECCRGCCCIVCSSTAAGRRTICCMIEIVLEVSSQRALEVFGNRWEIISCPLIAQSLLSLVV